MSVRAYRVIKKELADDSSFNLWHDNDLLDFFNDNNEYGLDLYHSLSESGGEIEIPVSVLQKAVDEYKWEQDDYRLETIKKDIEWAKENNKEWISYDCF